MSDLQKQLQKLEEQYNLTTNQDEDVKKLINDTKVAISKLPEDQTKIYDDETKKAIEGAGNTLASTVTMIAAAVDGDWYAFAQNGLDVVSRLAMTVGVFFGPVGEIVGVAIAAVCEVVSSVIGFFQPKGESLVSQIRRVIVEELKRYEFDEVTKRKVRGWCYVESTMIHELTFHLQKLIRTGKCSYTGFDPRQLDNEVELMGELTFLAEEEFTKMAEEVEANKKDATQCLSCIAGYTTVCWNYIMLLSMHKILCSHYNTKNALPQDAASIEHVKIFDAKATSDAKATFNAKATFDVSHATEARFVDNIELLDSKIEKAMRDAKKFLGFLSDEGLLGPAGWWLGKLRVMIQYRRNPTVFTSVEYFRKFLGCDPSHYYSSVIPSILIRKSVLDECIQAGRKDLTPELQWNKEATLLDPFIAELLPEARSFFDSTPTRDITIYQFFNNSRLFMNIRFDTDSEHICISPYDCASKHVDSRSNKITSGSLTIGKEKVDNFSDVQIIEFGNATASSAQWLPRPVCMSVYANAFSVNEYAKLFYFHGEMYFVQGAIGRTSDAYVFSIVVEEFDVPKLIEKSTLPQHCHGTRSDTEAGCIVT